MSGRLPIMAARVIAVVAVLAAPAASVAGGDAAAGQRKSLTCTACHVASDPADVPHLAGRSPGDMAEELRAFRKRDRANPLMNAIAAQLSDADIDDLAAFWSGQPANSDSKPSSATAAIRTSRMAFPRDFPSGFTLYLTTNVAEQSVIKKIYINAVGLEAARRGRRLPVGSIIMVVKHAARLGPDQRPLVDASGAWVIDRITSYAGMEARAGWGNDIPEWLRNASWNYGSFTAERTPTSNTNQAVCLACHKPLALVGYLFTFNELSDAARAR